jgi:UDP-N-acetylmuramoyl-tripeptide--D-alanyl-D-alanine ligase
VIPLELELLAPLGRLSVAPGAGEVRGVQIDSRRLAPGELFVAIGRGSAFAEEALARGAAAVLVPDDAELALAAIAGEVRNRSRARVVGITGAVGKTTTREILRTLCAPHLRTVASEANFNNELGVPLTLCRIEPETELCLVELGMRGLGQIAWLAAFVRPQIGLITKIAPVHLELVGSVENVARAKAELIEALPPGGAAVVPDDPLLEPYLTRTDIEIRRLPALREAGRFELGNGTLNLETSFSSQHQLENTLAALTVCELLGVPLPEGRLEVDFGPWREQLVELDEGVLVLNDCYNANPSSMRAALAHLAALAGSRRQVAVLGEMAELGAEAPRLHRELGAALAGSGVAVLVAVGPLGAELAAAADGVERHLVAGAGEAAELLAGLLRRDDVVLVKGSRAAGLEAVTAKLAS